MNATLIKCQRCGGAVLLSYGELGCTNCGAEYDSEGNWLEPKVRKGKVLQSGHRRITFTRPSTEVRKI